MSDSKWERWVMQTARTWNDLAPIIKETGISIVDHDHRRLIEYALELNDLLLRMEDHFDLDFVEEQENLMDRFLSYTREHFDREVEFLEKYNLPGLERQKEEHLYILRMLDEIFFEFKTGRISSAFKLRLEILNWVIKHINTTDYEVFDFFNICESILEIDSWDDISGFIRNIHVPPIDLDHKNLTEAIMKVGRAIRSYSSDNNPDLQNLIDALMEVLKQTYRHFAREEELIKKYSVPGIKTQQDQHGKFINYLNGQMALLNEGNPEKLDELERELLFWWIQHINIYDYKTFGSGNWIGNVFSTAKSADDVSWLISPTGIEDIDQDHYHFVVLLFKLKHLINPEANHQIDREECVQEISAIIDYAVYHFSREEQIMINAELPGIERHVKEHNRIINQLVQHKKGLRNNLIDLSGQLRDMLLSWWVDHTNGMDFETFGAHYEE